MKDEQRISEADAFSESVEEIKEETQKAEVSESLEALSAASPMPSIAARLNIPEFNTPTDMTETAPDTLEDEFSALSTDEEETETVPVDAPEDIPAEAARTSSEEDDSRANNARLSETDRIRKRCGLSKEDVALAIELGYEDDLGRLVGYEGLKKLKQEYHTLYQSPGKKHYRLAFGYCGEEALNDTTAPAIIAKYVRDKKQLLRRTVLTAIAAFILLFIDYPELLGGVADGLIATHPALFPLISFGILLAASALSFRQINAGLRSFLRATPTPYSVPATMLVLVLLYDVVTFFLREEVLHVNMLTCALLVVLSLCDVYRLLGEIRAFRQLSQPEEKTVLEPVAARKKTLRRDRKIVKVINDDKDVRFYRVQHTRQITGFFRRFNTTRTARLPFQTLLGISIAFAVVIAFVAAAIHPSLSYALSTFITVLFAAAPTTAMFSFFYPLHRANKILEEKKCVLVGNEAVSELSEPATLVFDDVDLCSAKKLSEIAVKDGADLHRDLRLAGTLLRALGGTLDCISKVGFHNGDGASVSFSAFADNGVEALIDGDYRVLLGDSDFMKKNNVRLPKESADQPLRRASNVAQLFFAVDGVVKLSYEIEYILKLSFMAIIEELATIDTSVAVQSYDPAINDAFLLSALEDKQVRIRAVKPGRYEGDALLDEADSGAVAIGRTHNVIYPLYAARAVKRAKKFGLHMQILISAIGIFLAGFYAFFPEVNILTPLSVTLYHGAFILITWLYTHLIINRRSLHIRRYF